MSAPDPKMVALLAEHANDGCGDCICSEYVLDGSFSEHLAQVLADAGIGDVGSRNVAMDLIHEADEQRERAERADARVAAVVASVLALADDSCHHCGKMPDDDGNHTCPCPLSDSECLRHLADPVISREAVLALVGQADAADALAKVRQDAYDSGREDHLAHDCCAPATLARVKEQADTIDAPGPSRDGNPYRIEAEAGDPS